MIVLDNEQQKMLLLLGWLALQCGQTERAIDLLELLLEVQPDNLEGRRVLLLALLQAGNGRQALVQCATLRDSGESTATLWFCESRAQQLCGQHAAARQAYEHFLSQKGANEHAV
ncbi:Chaperone protein YscY [compost metagenome]